MDRLNGVGGGEGGVGGGGGGGGGAYRQSACEVISRRTKH